MGMGNTAGAAEALNVTYNIADFVNKIAFVLACWSCAKSDSSYSDEWSTLQIKSQGAKAEAAEKLIGNHIRVINDICNPSPISQGNLARVSANNMGDVERMLLEVARRLSGNPGRSPSISAEVCSTTAAYLAQRTQSADSQCNGTPHQGRKADMSTEAAAAFLAEVKAVASGAKSEWSTLQIKSQGPKAEAAEKLIGNYINVINDICNPSPISQGNLVRVSANNMGDVEQMLLEVARRLSGNAGRSPRVSAEVCNTTAAYLTQRTQSADNQCDGTPHQGRKADMSKDAAAVFLATVKAVASQCSV